MGNKIYFGFQSNCNIFVSLCDLNYIKQGQEDQRKMKKSMTRSESVKRDGKQGGQQPREHNHRARTLVTILMYLLAFAIVYFSYLEYPLIKNNLLFTDAKTKKIESQLNLISQISLFFALFMFGNWIALFLVTTFTSRRQDDCIVHAIRRNISNSLEHFVIFLGLYAYLLVSEQTEYKKKQYVLLANWFVLSRVLYGILSIIDAKFKHSFRELGSTLGILAISAMVLNVAGYNMLVHI